MKFILLCVFIYGFMFNQKKEKNYKGSCVIGVVTEKTVTIGGESNLVYADGVFTKAPNHCKVYSNGNLIYGGAGYLLNKSNGVTFDPLKNIEQMKFVSKNIEGKINEIYKNLHDSFVFQASSINTSTPDFNNKLISIIFGSFENESPIMGALEIRFSKDASNATYLIPRIVTTSEFLSSVVIGETEFYNDYLEKHPDYIEKNKSNIDEAISFLIKGQSKILPKKVNESISLIKVDSTGVSWLKRCQECE